MEKLILFAVAAILGYWLYRKLRRWRIAARARHIDEYRFPDAVRNKLVERYPHLTPDQTAEVMIGLREYFHICNIAGRRMVSMPSQAVDVAWHEFILFTRNYQRFCRKALGRFLHHTPAEAMPTPTLAQDGIKRAWRIACRRERIDPKLPDRLPLLFALDGRLGIPDGFSYTLDCRSTEGGGTAFCAGHIGCGGGCGGDSGGWGDSGGDSSGCGGGCGGD